MKKTVIELFAGVGGFRCGLNNVTLKNDKGIENGDWDFVWANQWEPATKTQDAYDCYIKRFGSKDVSNKDINKVNKKDIPNHTLLVGGFPCQDYSVARTLASGKGIEGKKGVLWWSINDTLKAKKPPFVLLENVDRLLISPAKQRGRDFGIILKSFLNNGYAVEWRVINAGEYGMPQKRRRTYIFAYRNNTKHYKEMKKVNLRDIIYKNGIFVQQFPITEEELDYNVANISDNFFKDLLDVSDNFKMDFYSAGVMIDGKIYTSKVVPKSEKIYPLKKIIEKDTVADKFFLSDDRIKKFAYLKGSKHIPRKKADGFTYTYAEGAMPFPDNLDAPARTMLTSEGGTSRTTHVVEDYQTKKLRLLTPVECERINGFPDNWTNTGMTDKRRNFMMGNALVVEVIKKIGIEINEIIKKEN